MNRAEVSRAVRQAGGRVVYEDIRTAAYGGLALYELEQIGETCGHEWEIIGTDSGEVLQVYFS